VWRFIISNMCLLTPHSPRVALNPGVGGCRAWTALVPARFARRTARPSLSSVTGSWYLWPLGTQSVAIAAAVLAAAVLAADGELPAEPA
jgi:hypothetical protein